MLEDIIDALNSKAMRDKPTAASGFYVTAEDILKDFDIDKTLEKISKDYHNKDSRKVSEEYQYPFARLVPFSYTPPVTPDYIPKGTTAVPINISLNIDIQNTDPTEVGNYLSTLIKTIKNNF